MDPDRQSINFFTATKKEVWDAFVPHVEPDEKILYSTKGKVTTAKLKDIPAFVTNRRVIFFEEIEVEKEIDTNKYRSTFTRAQEVPIADLVQYKLAHEGFFSKRQYLQLDDQKIYGEHQDLTGLYEAIRSVKRT